MPATEPDYAPLTAAMIRRAPPLPMAKPVVAEQVAVESIGAITPPSAWREDLRLFAITWVFGFVFFLAFIG